MKVTLKKRRYNALKLWGALNFSMGLIGLLWGRGNGTPLSIGIAALCLIMGLGLLILTRGRFVERKYVEMIVNTRDEDETKFRSSKDCQAVYFAAAAFVITVLISQYFK
ncbi:hypothetical protein G6355_12325 [Vibrio cholerae]|uniref:hypothetical protein n=1 Tax=Vibrio cholerae TaxID=666 RepID=UPI002F306FB8